MLLTIDDLCVAIKTTEHTVQAVRKVRLSVAEGEIVGLVGESGSGKSVTASAIMGILPKPMAQVSGGTITLLGRDITRLSNRQLRDLRGKQMSMIFQEPMTALNPTKKIAAQMLDLIKTGNQGLSRGAMLDLARQQLADMELTDQERVLNAYPHELSGGMRQRVLIAMATSFEVKLLIADEPTTALDSNVEQQILSLLRKRARQRNAAVLLITHDLSIAAEFCSRIYVMHNGEVVESGDAETIIRRPTHPYTRALLGALAIRPARIALAPQSEQRAGVAASVVETKPPALLQVRDLTIKFPIGYHWWGGARSFVTAVSNASLTLGRGETLSIIGETGSGKTTLCRAILGLTRAHSGDILYKAQRIRTFDRAERKRRNLNVQVVFQDPASSLNPRMQAWRIVTEPLCLARKLPSDRLKAQAAEILRQVGLDASHLDRYPHEMSGGQRQRLAIGRAISTSPEIIVLDEPTSALDVVTRKHILGLLLELQAKHELAFVLITHDLAAVRLFTGPVAVMHQGRIIETGSAAQLFANPQQAYTKRLVTAHRAIDLFEENAS